MSTAQCSKEKVTALCSAVLVTGLVVADAQATRLLETQRSNWCVCVCNQPVNDGEVLRTLRSA
jgi:hypothetical protein